MSAVPPPLPSEPRLTGFRSAEQEQDAKLALGSLLW